MSPAQLRTTFETAGIGPVEARTVLRRLTEAGLVIGADEPAKTPTKGAARRTPAGRPPRHQPRQGDDPPRRSHRDGHAGVPGERHRQE